MPALRRCHSSEREQRVVGVGVQKEGGNERAAALASDLRWSSGCCATMALRVLAAAKGTAARGGAASVRATPLASAARRRTIHAAAPCCYNWRWPKELGGGEGEGYPKVDDDISLKMRSLKMEGRVTPRKKKGKKRFTKRDHEQGLGEGMAPGVLRSDAWMLQKSASFHEKGVNCVKRRKYAEARLYFEQSIELHGNHPKTYLAWARMEQRLGQLDRTRELLEEGLRKDPRNPFLMQAFGVLEGEVGNTEAARSLFIEALEVKPRDAVTYQSWGMLEAREGNEDTAEFVFKEAHKRVPKKDRAGILHAWGELEVGRDNVERARVLFLKSVQADALEGHTYCSWGQLEEEQGNIDKARELFLRGVRAAPHSAHLLHAWAHMEAVQGDAESARALLKECLKVSPGNVKALDVWGKLEKAEGNEEAADAIYKRMEKAKAKREGAATAGDFEDVAEQYESEPTTTLEVAVAEGKKRNIATARATFEEALEEADDGGLEVLAAWSRMETRFRNYDRARTLLHQALDVAPDDAKLLRLLGHTEHGARHVEEARRLYQAATIAEPAAAATYAAWGRLERKQGRLDRAREVIGRGLGAAPQADHFGQLVEAAVLERVAGNPGTAREMVARADQTSDPPSSSSIPQQILGMVERSVGNTAAARAAFREALQRNPRCAGTAREWAVLESEAAHEAKLQVRSGSPSLSPVLCPSPLCLAGAKHSCRSFAAASLCFSTVG